MNVGRTPVKERITRHVKGMISLCDESADEPMTPTLAALLRDLAVKSHAVLIELKKELPEE